MADDKTLPVVQAELAPVASNTAATGMATDSTAPITTLVEVAAPSDLPEGYEFDAQLADGKVIKVTVPPGGVQAGQNITVPMPKNKTTTKVVTTTTTTTQQVGNGGPPTGRWRDNLCDCCKFGCCHAFCCLTFWCEAIALGQVMTRMKLNMCGSPNNDGSGTFTAMVIINITYIALRIILNVIFSNGDYYNGNPIFALDLIFGLFIFFVTFQTRSHIRSRYSIPEESCGGCEDCCCAFWCPYCVICQMGRHTADYANHSADCCSATGLPSGVPVVV